MTLLQLDAGGIGLADLLRDTRHLAARAAPDCADLNLDRSDLGLDDAQEPKPCLICGNPTRFSVCSRCSE